MVKRGDWRQRGSVEMGDEEQPGEAEAGTRDIDHGRDRTLGSKLDHRVLNFFIGTISVEFTKNDPDIKKETLRCALVINEIW